MVKIPFESICFQEFKEMTDTRLEDLHIESIKPIITPRELKARLPLSETAIQTVIKERQVVKDILDRKDKRLMVVIGRNLS